MYFLKNSLAVLSLLCLLFSCDEDSIETGPSVDLTRARFANFDFVEVANTNAEITHPELMNGAEVERGKILITIPKRNTQLRLTPKLSNFSNSKFTVTPALDLTQDFSGGAITYTITSVADPQQKVQYDITVTEEDPNTFPDQTGISAFKFEKSRNPELPADIAATRITHGEGTIGKIYIFVPAGTDFSSLTPAIAFNGSGLYYTQDPHSVPEQSTTQYPAEGASIDFAYPKSFYAVVKHASGAKTYDVIVDVINPILPDNAVVTTADVVKGATRSVEATHITNQGNHPLLLYDIDYTNQLPAGFTVIRAYTPIPSLGLEPGERIPITAMISAQTYPPGTYQTTAVFKPKFYHEDESAELLEATDITFTATITD